MFKFKANHSDSENMSTRLRVNVGDNKEFQVQKELLCKHSDMFKEILSEPLVGQQSPIHIVNTEADVFASFVGYLHDEDIYLATGIPTVIHQKSDGPSHGKRQSFFYHLVKCYVLGWELKAYSFCNAITDVLVDFSRKGNKMRFIAGGTKGIRESVAAQATFTPLHELLQDNYAGFAKHPKSLEQFRGMADPEEKEEIYYVLDGINKSEILDKEEKLKFSWERDLCYYHKHPGQNTGYSCTGKQEEPKAKKLTKKRKRDNEGTEDNEKNKDKEEKEEKGEQKEKNEKKDKKKKKKKKKKDKKYKEGKKDEEDMQDMTEKKKDKKIKKEKKDMENMENKEDSTLEQEVHVSKKRKLVKVEASD